MYPIIKDIELDRDMTDEEAFTTSLQAFNIPDKLAEGLDTLCCGWASRGVAFGDGKVKH
ncbi:hypothetical protein QGM71_17245 [Virgibacillus sp. C22-A2]|uniref:Uncharacterized protein n=1 Tax=Virgibacillus tibetensis TaxID=3042313 RepID=A0ABU6KIS8_9BACI|nr:hypothetical protein [Virgibacillus sp. C22-A2]